MLVPKAPTDLLLAPVALRIEANLARLRVLSGQDILMAFALELDVSDRMTYTSDQRAEFVREFATRFVDLHGLLVRVSDDKTRLRLEDADFGLELGLSPSITSYIDFGAARLDTPRT